MDYQNKNAEDPREKELKAQKERPLMKPRNQQKRGQCRKKNGAFKMEYRHLEKLLLLPPEEIVRDLSRTDSGYAQLLTTDFSPQMFLLILKVLSKATAAKLNNFSCVKLVSDSFTMDFVHKCSVMIMHFKVEAVPSECLEMLKYLAGILDFIVTHSPTDTVDKVLMVSDSSLSCYQTLVRKGFSEESTGDTLKSIEERMEYFHKKHLSSSVKTGKVDKYINDSRLPPDNFRSLPVVPVLEDFANEKPFLRRNIVNGQYDNLEHYLDVQFRLYREDFVQPLRNGLQNLTTRPSCIPRKVGLYTRVKPLSLNVIGSSLVHYFKLKLRMSFNAETSKRFLYGSIVCLSKDSFLTFEVGSVSDRQSLKNMEVGIKIESEESSIDFHAEYEMVESKAFFMAYRHTLSSLQRIISLPLSEYIIRVQKEHHLPQYLLTDPLFDISLLYEGTCFQLDIEDAERIIVNLTFPICDWPSCERLALDHSQRRALHAALSREFTVIQGPPGTGKTYLGLKITKLLLGNASKWNTDGQNPILVIAYTNHALDQFLEGIAKFTNSIVRVGSQSKSEVIKRFNINRASYFFNEGNFEPRWRVLDVQVTVSVLATDLKTLKKQLDDLRGQGGILDASVCKKYGMPYPGCSMSHWLDVYSENFPHIISRPEAVADSLNSHDMLQLKEEKSESEEDAQNRLIFEELCDSQEYQRKLDDDLLLHSELNVDAQVNVMPLYELCIEDEVHKKREIMPELVKQHQCQRIYDPHKIRSLERKLRKCETLIRNMNTGLSLQFSDEEFAHLSGSSLHQLPILDRWKLHNSWVKHLVAKLEDTRQNVEKEYIIQSRILENLKRLMNLELMKGKQIVGMTTTGAAQYHDVLQSLGSKIVIIEEAAEILEAHVVASLPKSCEHLIMIGDHQQLKPRTTVYELAKHYNLDTSLFERMINNGIDYITLEYQHRMRPSISKLIVPAIYPDLKDSPNVLDYSPIRGLDKDVFFINHSYSESKSKDDKDSAENKFEADLMIALCKHLLLQGYETDDITILTPYSGQFFLLRKLQNQQEKNSLCKCVRISILDNYQGEECNIILLSLVRSNEEGRVGFLKTENRVCVALSRAKQGLYVAGNMEQLKASTELWTKIEATLKEHGMIGEALLLKCVNHPLEKTEIRNASDFRKCPEGGCSLTCTEMLPCTHVCRRFCHVLDREHTDNKCYEQCLKVCPEGHSCSLRCNDECQPCKVKVKRTLPCGHDQEEECSIKVADIKCKTQVRKKLPVCHHKNMVLCSDSVDTVQCTYDCVVRLDCGHVCRNKCHEKTDPDHAQVTCQQPCERYNAGCHRNHKCQLLCGETCMPCEEMIQRKISCGHRVRTRCGLPEEEIKCSKKCNKVLGCGHYCPCKCREECGGCTVTVTKVIPACGHSVQVPCSTPPTRHQCMNACSSILSCGHICRQLCSSPCTTSCEVKIETKNLCPRRHTLDLPCHMIKSGIVKCDELLHEMCIKPCGQVLQCDHVCQGQCGECLNGRLHVPCAQICSKPLVCGHICKIACGVQCPPCQEKCEFKCKHSTCKKTCGAPCMLCVEKCTRACPHLRCTGKCGQLCTREPCSEPCTKRLKCSHPCIGFCGEPCPPQCRICNASELTKFILLGYEEDIDSRFVLLEDCGHAIEARALEEWLTRKDGSVGMPRCPRCSQPIYNTRRAQKAILEAYKDVQVVKSKYYTTLPKIRVTDIITTLVVRRNPEVPHSPLKRNQPTVLMKHFLSSSLVA